jgi:hypothetical protein
MSVVDLFQSLVAGWSRLFSELSVYPSGNELTEAIFHWLLSLGWWELGETLLLFLLLGLKVKGAWVSESGEE